MSSTPPPAYRAGAEAEEYAVYSAVLTSEVKRYNPGCTKLTILNDFPARDGRTRSVHHGLLKYLNEGVRDDFEAKNKQPYKLKRLLEVRCPYVLVSVKECQELISRRKKKEYEATCPDLSRTLTLSRVGFNHEMNQALVYVGIQSTQGAGSGSGAYYLLSKEAGRWTIQIRFTAFVT